MSHAESGGEVFADFDVLGKFEVRVETLGVIAIGEKRGDGAAGGDFFKPS